MQWHVGTGMAGRQAGLSISVVEIFMRFPWRRARRTGHLQKTHTLYSSCEGDDCRSGETCSAGTFKIALSEVPSENPDDKGVWYARQNW